MVAILFFSSHAVAESNESWDKLYIWPYGLAANQRQILSLEDGERQLVDALVGGAFDQSLNIILKHNGKYFLKNYCNMEVYHWTDGHWKFFSGKSVTGYSCAPYLFFKEDELYGFSGYGYWEKNVDLFHFSSNGESEFISTKNQPSNFFGYLNFITDQGFYTLMGPLHNFRVGLDEFFWDGYFLDLKTLTWKPIQTQFNDSFFKEVGKAFAEKLINHTGDFETTDFAGHEFEIMESKKKYWLIMDKKTLQLYLKPMNRVFLQEINWMQTEGNTLRFFTKFDVVHSQFQVKDLIATAIPAGTIKLIEEFSEPPFWLNRTSLFLLGFLIVMFAIVVTWKKLISPKQSQTRNGAISTQFSTEITPWITKVLKLEGLVISQEEMDEVLGIHYLKNPDIRKTNRSRAIKSINEAMEPKIGEPLITRIRDKEDKRVIHYQIARFHSVKSPIEGSKSPVSA